MNKRKIIMRIIAIIIAMVFSINSFAAVISDSDGSTFITKTEFEALKNDFRSQIDNYNTSIDSKIDGAIAAYLAGIRLATATPKEPMFKSIYGEKLTFHNGDDYNKTYVEDDTIWGSYNLFSKTFNLVNNEASYNGDCMLSLNWRLPKSKFILIHKLKWDEKNQEWTFDRIAEDAEVKWLWVSKDENYTVLSGTTRYMHWAWAKSTSYVDIVVGNGMRLGSRGTDYNCWAETSTNSRSYDETNTSTRPSWVAEAWTQQLKCGAGDWIQYDNGEWKKEISHLWVKDDDGVIERMFDMTSQEIQYLTVEPISSLKCDATESIGALLGAYSNPKFVQPTVGFTDVYAFALHGWKGNSSYDVLKRKTRLKPSNVKYVIESGLKEPIKQNLWQAPLFDRVERDAVKLQFEITMLKKDGYGDATIYFSKKTWANENCKPADNDIVKIYKGDSEVALDSIALKAGEKTKIEIRDLKKDDLLFFSLVPASGSKAKIDVLENCNYYS